MKEQGKVLRGISSIISPELIATLMSMGHGDELVIADGNFPAARLAQRLLRADGHGAPEILDAILGFFPLDRYVPHPVALMDLIPGDKAKTDIWETYRKIISGHEPSFVEFAFLERFAFYERTRAAYAVLATSEMAIYANIILKKGLVSSEK